MDNFICSVVDLLGDLSTKVTCTAKTSRLYFILTVYISSKSHLYTVGAMQVLDY